MKIVLRHSRTGFYYQGGRDWSDAVEDALEFATIQGAALAGCDQQLDQALVVLRHDTGCELALPLEICVETASKAA